MRRYLSLLLLVFSGILIFSCKEKGKEEEEKVVLSSSFPQVTFSLPVTETGWYYLTLSVKGKGFRWDREESSVVIDAYDSLENWLGDLVLWNPHFTYRLFVGRLEKGQFQVTLKYSVDKSPAEKGKVTLEKVRLERISSVPEECLEHYPYLLGYSAKSLSVNGRSVPYNSLSDLPLFWVCRRDGSKLIYVLYYSNEDGGTGLVPGYLMYAWGRTADIENAFTVDLESGEMWKRDNETKDTPFKGENYLGHPLLSVAPSDHGLVAEGKVEDQSGQLLFAPLILPDLSLHTREDYLDQLPWSYLIMEWEMEREKKISTEDLTDQVNSLAPLNYYLYMDLYIDDDDCQIGMRVLLDSGEEISNATSSLAWNFKGWKRVVLKLPAPVSSLTIKNIALINLSGDECEVKIGKLFYLNDDFQSFSPILTGSELNLKIPAGGEKQVIPLFQFSLPSPQ